MTQPAAEPIHAVLRAGFANPLTLDIQVTDDSYVKVYVDDVLLDSSEYLVEDLNDPDGVNIYILDFDEDFYPDALYITAVFEPPIEQGADLSAGGAFGRAFENAIDAIVRMIISLKGGIDRTVKVPYGVPGDIVLPTPVPGATFMWDEDGQALVNGPTAENIGNADTIVAEANAAADRAEAAAELAEDVVAGTVTFNRPVQRFVIDSAGPYDMGVGSTIAFANNLDVKIGGVEQDHDTYTVAGTTFTLLNYTTDMDGLPMEAALAANIRQLNAPSDGSVGLAAFDPDVNALLDEIAGGNAIVYEYNVMSYGADEDNTEAENRQALEDAIAACDAAGGGVVRIPQRINYGYEADDDTTHPDFSGVSSDMVVLDYGPGSTYSAPSKDGMQIRWFFHTEQTTPVGQHDGNGHRIVADWHPYHWLDVSGGYIDYGGGAGGRTADYNYRASILFGLEGDAIWQFGQGARQGNLSDTELLDLHLVGYVAGVATYYPLIVDYTNGAAVYGLGTSAPQAAHHFDHPDTVVALPTLKVKNRHDTAMVITLGNSNGEMTLTLDASLHIVSTEAILAPYFRANQYATGARPDPIACGAGAMVYDATLSKPVWSDGTAWRDAAGTLV
jgi:hypothetical protein